MVLSLECSERCSQPASVVGLSPRVPPRATCKQWRAQTHGNEMRTAPGAVALDIMDTSTTTTALTRGMSSLQGGSTWTAVLKDTVRSAVGLVAAEVWLETSPGSAMRRPGGGSYGDPVYQSEALEFLAADAGVASPGVGLAGILLSTASYSTARSGKAEASAEWTQLKRMPPWSTIPRLADPPALTQPNLLLTRSRPHA